MSTQSKHTPGPWFATKGRDVMAGDRVICTAYVPNDSGDRDEAQANARLIAAAPALLAALEQAISVVETEYADDSAIVQQCCAAIAQARGEG